MTTIKKPFFSLIATGALLALSVAPFAAQAEISEKDFNAAMEKFLQSDSGMDKLGDAIENHFQKR